MTPIWIATSNQGKLNEFRNLLNQVAEVHSLSELKFFAAPVENGKTFAENARIKAKALRAIKSDQWVIGEDSGLEVEGLNNLPGIFSARYAGDKASDGENVAKLLKMLQIRSPQKRQARFRCVMVAISPSGQEFVIEGEIAGQIASVARGKEGFGYDPVFIPDGESQTFAELGQSAKNKISHRAQAIRKFSEILGRG